MASSSSTALVEIYRPYLTNIPEDPSQFNPFLGGQSFGTCCLLAVNESLYIDNGTLRIRPGQSFFRGDMATLERFPSFPCTATFNGTMEGPPEDFWTPYSWCRRRCPGWAATSPETFGNWLKPLSAFILPSLIFSLNIPRRRRIEIPRGFVSCSLGGVWGMLLNAVTMAAAFIISTVDLLIWLSVVFAVAGPILVSAIYEALLDARVLRFLQRRLSSNSLSVRSRAHLLLVLLLGNLDFDPAWYQSTLFVQGLPKDAFLAPIASGTMQGFCWTDSSFHLFSVKSRLHAMLDSQPSFGDTIGAPVLFYIAAFIWSVYEIEASYGTYQSAHQISFGLLWMTIPHIALITSLLLAGNSPSIFQGAISGDSQIAAGAGAILGNGSSVQPGTRTMSVSTVSFLAWIRRHFSLLSKAGLRHQSTSCTSPYRTAWVWNRGSNKARWIAKLANEHHPHLDALHDEVLGRRFGTILSSAGFWAFVLIFIPVFFGGVVSYHTPSVGFGCWSLTMLCYGSNQLLLIILWLVNMLAWERGADGKVIHDVAPIKKSGSWGYHVWHAGFALSVCISVFTSVGGTIFILTGLYSNCLCFTPARYWYNIMTNPDATIFWSSATDTQLYYSQKWWFPAGVIGTVFMAAIAYLGWWYQKRLRSHFHHLVGRISDVDEKHLRESTGVEVNQQSASP